MDNENELIMEEKTLKEVIMDKAMTRQTEDELAIMDDVIVRFYNAVDDYISFEQIVDKLYKNNYDGMYLVTRDEMDDIAEETTTGSYITGDKRIFIVKNSFISNSSIAIHELAHAYIDGGISKTIEIDGKKVCYGTGLEEGFASIIESIDATNMNEYITNVYLMQTRIIQQLNQLYYYDKNRKYIDLVDLVLNKPEDLFITIREIYSNILKNINEKIESSGKKENLLNDREINMLIDKISFNIIEICDVMLKAPIEEQIHLFGYADIINSIMLSLSDPRVRKGENINKLFNNCKQLVETREEILLKQIFGDYMDYESRMLKILDSALVLITSSVENYEMDDDCKEKRLV